MARVYFESVYVDPDDRTTDLMRRHRLPAWKIVLFGILGSVLVAGIAFTQQVLFAAKPLPTVAQAQSEAKAGGRNVLLVFHASNPRVRMQLMDETFDDEAVQAVLEKGFVVLHLDRTMPRYSQHMATYEIRRTPAFVVTAADGSILRTASGEPVRHVGNIGPASLIALLSSEFLSKQEQAENDVKRSTRRLADDPERTANVPE